MLQVHPIGPSKAKVMILGDYADYKAEIVGTPYPDTSTDGKELRRLLRESGLSFDDCYVTYVCRYAPPSEDITKWITDKPTIGKKSGFELVAGKWAHPILKEERERLAAEIASVEPTIIIGLGNLALWACTDNWGVGNWRGSEMLSLQGPHFVPTYSPESIMRGWHLRPQVIHDLKYRVKRRITNGFPTINYNFNTAPTFDEVAAFLNNAKGYVAADIETAGGHIICLGLASSAYSAICIPFRNSSGVYWDQDQYRDLLRLLKDFSERSDIVWVGQNWNYDAQYFDEDFGWTVMSSFDTLIAQSVLYPGSERGLGYLSSMYCDHHLFWKEDAKDWGKVANFDSLFRYNCLDVCRTWEIAQVQQKLLEQAGLTEQFKSRMDYSHTVYRMMRKGVNRDQARTDEMVRGIVDAVHERELLVAQSAGHPVNFGSPPQVGKLLYQEMGLKPVGKTTAKGKASTADDALTKLVEKYPVAKEVCSAILEARSLNTIRSTFLEAELDPDGRLRSSWMATGTETFRCTSSKNAFHRGGPLQNITDGQHTHSGRKLPNLRSTIVPDSGYTIFNCDLERADLQVVAWEAEDEDLKTALKEGLDLHLLNAQGLFDLPFTLDDLRDPAIVNRLKVDFEQQRHFGKTFVHLTNYGGGARTCAIKTKTTIHQAEMLQRKWFEKHPGIKKWHDRTLAQLYGTRTITNKFGYRRIYFDRVDGLLPEALAWLPQSTVSIVISLVQMAVEQQVPEVEFLLQVHDSIVGQYPTHMEEDVLPRIHQASKILVPYPDPLYIPLDLATSTASWGEVTKREWP